MSGSASLPPSSLSAPPIITSRAEDVDALVAQLVGDRPSSASPLPDGASDAAGKSPSATPVTEVVPAKPAPVLSAAPIAVINLVPRETYSKEVQTMEIQTEDESSPKEQNDKRDGEPGSAETLSSVGGIQTIGDQDKGAEPEAAHAPSIPRGLQDAISVVSNESP